MQEDSDPLTSLKAALQINHAAKSASKSRGGKGVVVDRDSGLKATDVNSTLTSNETARYTKIFTIFKNVVFPGPEAEKTSAKERIDKPAQVSATADAAKKFQEGKEKSGGELLGMLGLIAGVLAFTKEWIKKIVKGLKAILKTVKGAINAVWNGLKKLGSKLLGFLKQTAKTAGTAIKKIFSNLWNSKWAGALKGAITNAFGKLGEFMDKARNFVRDAAKRLVQSIPGGSTFMKGFNTLKGAVTSGVRGAAEFTGRAFAATGQAVQSAASNVGRAARYVGGVVINSVTRAKNALGKVLNPIIKSGGKKILTKIPIVGSAIEAAFTAYDVNKYANDPEKGEDELKKLIGNRVIQGIGGVGGGALAAALTTATGAGALVSVPAFFLGDQLGRYVAKLFTDNYDMSSLGGLVMDAFNITPTSSRGEMQDFIVQRGTVYPFSSKDSVLGMKTGGVIDKLLSERGNNSTSLNIQQVGIFNDMKQIGMLQLDALIAIRDGIFALASASSTTRTTNNAGLMQVELTQNQLTTDYYTA